MYTSSKGTKTKGIMPLLCETAGTSGLCDSSSCHPSTTPRMSSSGLLTSLSFTPLVTSESRSIRLLDPAVVPLNLYKKQISPQILAIWQKQKNLQPKVTFNSSFDSLPTGSTAISGCPDRRLSDQSLQ